jgi:hypothetical protein
MRLSVAKSTQRYYSGSYGKGQISEAEKRG